ncbi:Hsp33 family molecular chaperone HslO [Fervidobacterium sp. 2310opik-2]|uniref:Hsp33 family molecular chaperone HslO n=1 Tax=Fervidobacterium sp. 2310opik-2 TaxID=1755815 RepID=UPI0013E066F2|nr:Hsp33 family molecular chaperone HslO [Fervidobacterium sp. 2310opik-2]KAF2962137.1 molecular chaperone Hsp33 [Fervidobacterium sp. 2310opik-2]
MGRLIYGTAYDGMIRFSLIDSKDIVSELRERHKLSYLPTVVLGRLTTAAGLVIPWLSEKETITFVISGNGPAGNVVSQSSAKGTVRGYITNKDFELEPNEIGKFDVKNAIGQGELTVVRDVGLRTPYVSKVPLISGEIAEDVAYYYTKSEQIPSAFALGVLMEKNGVLTSGGLAVQILDRHLPNEVIIKIESNLKNFSMTHYLFDNIPLEEIASYVLGVNKLIYEETNVVFKCNCSKEKAFESIMILELEDLYELLSEEKAEVTCKWCGLVYLFDKEDIEKAIELKKKE